MSERVQKILARQGNVSRRQAEDLIRAGRVCLNGEVVELGQKADPDCDRLTLDGQVITTASAPTPIYLLLNKPRGVVSTCLDPQGRQTVIDCVTPPGKTRPRIYPVGRLDADSTGAILLTNDGDLTLKLTHPRYHLPKTYHVWVKGQPSANSLHQWRTGVMLNHRKTQPAQVTVLDVTPQKTRLCIILHEGRNRQIRRVAEQLGYPVVALHRVAIGTLKLNTPQTKLLAPGQYRTVSSAEIMQHLLPSSSPSAFNLPITTAENSVC